MDNIWGENCLSQIQHPVREFEDNFVAKYQLPHSQQYIESCERRLAKLRSQRSNAQNLLQALAQTKRSHLERIVDSNDSSISEPVIYQSVSSSPLQRFIAPEKEAKTIDELYELLKYDHLGQLFESLEKEKNK